MKLKITTVGNSAGIILPKELLSRLRWKRATNCMRWRPPTASA